MSRITRSQVVFVEIRSYYGDYLDEVLKLKIEIGTLQGWEWILSVGEDDFVFISGFSWYILQDPTSFLSFPVGFRLYNEFILICKGNKI